MNNTILIIDDDPISLKQAEFTLKKHDYICSKASSGAKALEMLEYNVPDLILLDVEMPDMDGFEFLNIIKKDEDLKEIPVLFLTGDNSRETEARCFKEGASDYINKPFSADVMLQRVKHTLELEAYKKKMKSKLSSQVMVTEYQLMQNEKLTQEVIEAMSYAVDAKDKYTSCHSARVRQYALMIAKKLEKSEEEMFRISCAALLHDIGKIGIPDSIINKPSKLTDEEYNLIKTHTEIGAEIANRISSIPEIMVGARWHHERWDGKGYPDKLEGNDIPEIAQIIGAADSYDAMTSRRSYRGLCPQSYVREEFVKNRGTQFAPEIADIMLQIIDEDVDYELHE